MRASLSGRECLTYVFSPWDTAISVTNPAYTDEMADGGLTFTFYAQTDDMGIFPSPYDSLQFTGWSRDWAFADGTLAAGSTYQVLASEILDYTDWGRVSWAMSICWLITPTVAGWVG